MSRYYFDAREFLADWSFVPIDSTSSTRLRRCFLLYADTPFVRGARTPGVGVDCVRFIADVYDLLYLRDRETEIPENPGDPAMIRTIRRGWFGFRRISIPRVQPGDLLAAKNPKTGKIVHAALVSTIEGEIWHASRLAGRVVRDGFQAIGYPFAILRPEERHRWAVPD